MARMIPDIAPQSIDNPGERRFYEAALALPDDFTVCYSFSYLDESHNEQTELFKEADFVIINPYMGYVVVEVKQGIIVYQNGAFYEQKGANLHQLTKDPLKQACEGMFAILHQYKERKKSNYFSLKIRYALCFPDCQHIQGIIPQQIDSNSILLFDALEQPGKLQERLVGIFSLLPSEDKGAA